MKEQKHLMLDIETMGNTSYSSILSVGAVVFDIETGATGTQFHEKIDLQSCFDLGLSADASTITWWLAQSDEAREGLTSGDLKPITQVLKEFSSFCNKEVQIWGNSARFDCGILQNAYNKANIPIPWDFRKERCLRTLVSFAPDVKNSMVSIGVAHDALDDCKFQIKYCSEIWRILNNK